MTDRPNGPLYVGVTSDLSRRVWEHRSGKIDGFTKQYDLKMLVYAEWHDVLATALQREKNIKHWNRAWKIKLILTENPEWDDLYDRLVRGTWIRRSSKRMTKGAD